MFKKLIEHTFTVIITVVLTSLIGAWFFGTSKLEYKTGIKESYFNIPDKAPKDLIIEHKGKQIDNISVYDFVIENNSLKDLESVDIYFEFTPKNDSELPPLISQGLYASKSYASNLGITELPKPADNIYAYNVDLIQHDSEIQYIARFIFEGGSVPNVRVSTPKNIGVRIVEYSYSSETLLGIFIGVALLSFLLLLIFFADGIGSENRWKKRKEKITKILQSEISESENQPKFLDTFFEKYDEEFKPKYLVYTAFVNGINRVFRKTT